VWVITMNAPPDNRLTPRMLITLNKHLDTVEAEWRSREDQEQGGALVLTSAIRKFFSNGFVPEILYQPGFGDGEQEYCIEERLTWRTRVAVLLPPHDVPARYYRCAPWPL